MRRLHLVRHAPVLVDLGRAATQWQLVPDARARLRGLADSLRGSGLRRIIASPEDKAAETGQILAAALGLPLEVRDGLEEHHRPVDQQSPSAQEFGDNLRRFFAFPTAVVFGTESADTARERFKAALCGVMDEGFDNELVVTHGRVMSLLIAAGGNGAAMEIWSSLQLPDHVVLDWPSLRRVGT